MSAENTTKIKGRGRIRPPGFEVHPERINRKGKPLGAKSVLAALRSCLNMTVDEFKKRYGASGPELLQRGNITLLEQFAAMDVHVGGLPVKGWAARQKIIDRIDGAPKQSMDVTSNGETIDAVAAIREIQERRAAREADEATKKP